MITWLTRGLLVLTASIGAWVWIRLTDSLALAWLGAVLMPFALQAVVLSTSFALSRVVASPIPPHLAQGWWTTLLAYLFEVRDSTLTFAWRMPWRSGWMSKPPKGHEQRPAVLLVHGFLCNRGLWAAVAPALNRRGYEVHAISLEPVWGSIEDYTDAMHEHIASLLATHSSLVIVGHSMGGLVARQALRQLDPAHKQRVVRIITLGTPHLGTVHARFGLGKNAAQMRRDSPWLQALFNEERSRGGLGVPSTVILSYHDNIVAPQALAWPYLEGQQEVVELSGIGHLSLALDHRVWALIFERLEAIPLRSESRA